MRCVSREVRVPSRASREVRFSHWQSSSLWFWVRWRLRRVSGASPARLRLRFWDTCGQKASPARLAVRCAFPRLGSASGRGLGHMSHAKKRVSSLRFKTAAREARLARRVPGITKLLLVSIKQLRRFASYVAAVAVAVAAVAVSNLVAEYFATRRAPDKIQHSGPLQGWTLIKIQHSGPALRPLPLRPLRRCGNDVAASVAALRRDVSRGILVAASRCGTRCQRARCALPLRCV